MSSSSSCGEVVSTNGAPSAIGPYGKLLLKAGFHLFQAIKTDLGLLFLSGVVPLDPKSLTIVEGGITEQTERVFESIKAILAEAGSDLSKVVKTTVFLKDMNDFAGLNAVYTKHFGEHKPCRSCVEVARLPKDALVEIECLALLKPASRL